MPKPLKSSTQYSEYVGTADTFNTYKNEYNITKIQYLEIVKAFFCILIKKLIYTGKVYAIPSQLGTISIRKTPTYGRGYFDYSLFGKTGVKRYIKNNHSEQFVALITWDKSKTRFKAGRLANMFRLYPARDFSRDLAKAIKKENTIIKYYDK